MIIKQQNEQRRQNVHPHVHGTLFILALTALQVFFTGQTAAADELTAQSLGKCVNEIRMENGGNMLSFNSLLTEAAENKLKDMQQYHYWAHENPETKKKPWDFVDEAGYYYHAVGENLAIGFEDSQKVCDAWEKSKVHFENIINPAYREFGFAVDKASLKSSKGILVVLLFGTREHPHMAPVEAKNQTEGSDNIFFAILFSLLSRLQ